MSKQHLTLGIMYHDILYIKEQFTEDIHIKLNSIEDEESIHNYYRKAVDYLGDQLEQYFLQKQKEGFSTPSIPKELFKESKYLLRRYSMDLGVCEF